MENSVASCVSRHNQLVLFVNVASRDDLFDFSFN